MLVHHRNLQALPETVRALLDEGIEPANLLVVDNSGDQVSCEELTAATTPGVVVTRIANRGYGNAVNVGVDQLMAREVGPEFIVVATHEVRPEPGSVGMLTAALNADPGIAAAGPLLHSRFDEGGESVAAGATRSRMLGIPRHAIVSGSAEIATLDPIVDRTWLDGALVAYRRSAFEDQRIREEFFLYVEETEFHYRLREEVGRIVCVTGAVVHEVANEVPPFLHARNLQWLFELHGNRLQRWLTVPWVIAKNVAKTAVGRQRWSNVKLMVTGWVEARRRSIDKFEFDVGPQEEDQPSD